MKILKRIYSERAFDENQMQKSNLAFGKAMMKPEVKVSTPELVQYESLKFKNVRKIVKEGSQPPKRDYEK
ncbi:hypothetical protein E9993_22405 [Labilibacter sediminis]|nr:hypothetical protein E9993_22405 [Labilibacter sediminis]